MKVRFAAVHEPAYGTAALADAAGMSAAGES